MNHIRATIVLTTLVILALVASCATPPPPVAASPCIAGNCTDGSGVYPDAGGTYSGQFLNNQRHGQGRETEPTRNNRLAYEGGYANDRKHDPGVLHIEAFFGGESLPKLVQTVFEADRRVGPETVTIGAYQWIYPATETDSATVTIHHAGFERYRSPDVAA